MNSIYFKDLRKKYTHDELSYFPGDNDLRYEMFSPVLGNLYENKVVYYEHFICVVRLKDISITPNGFHATAVPFLPIERDRRHCPPEPWSFGSPWRFMCLYGNSIGVPYAGWSIWPEPDLVKTVEGAALRGDFELALSLTLGSLMGPGMQSN